MISAVNLAHHKTIQPRIQKQQRIEQKQIRATNVNFTGKPNWYAASITAGASILSTGLGIWGLTNIIGDLHSFNLGEGIRNLIEATMGLGMGAGGAYATFKAITNKTIRYDFLEKYHLNR